MLSADHYALHPDVPTRLLALLDRLGHGLARRPDAIALLGVGSVGRDLHRLDQHSDADFWVVVEDPTPYLAHLDWLIEAAPIAWSFTHNHDGRKVLFQDGLFAEYAIFTVNQLRSLPRPATRIVWQRLDAPPGLDEADLPPMPAWTVEHQAGEAVTNLYVGLHRHLRGEILSATRLIQHHAVDRVIAILALLGHATEAQQDPFALERSVERRLPAALLPLGQLVQGYRRNPDSAEATLDLLQGTLDPSIVAAVRHLIARTRSSA